MVEKQKDPSGGTPHSVNEDAMPKPVDAGEIRRPELALERKRNFIIESAGATEVDGKHDAARERATVSLNRGGAIWSGVQAKGEMEVLLSKAADQCKEEPLVEALYWQIGKPLPDDIVKSLGGLRDDRAIRLRGIRDKVMLDNVIREVRKQTRTRELSQDTDMSKVDFDILAERIRERLEPDKIARKHMRGYATERKQRPPPRVY